MNRIALGLLLSWGLPAAAADFTVGAAGTYASIQDGIDAALAAAGDDRVLVQSGTYVETLTVFMGGSGDRLELSGGWDASFASQSDLGSTIDGNAVGIVMRIDASGTDHLVVTNFEITNGFDSTRGAGIEAGLAGSAVVEVIGNSIVDNLAEGSRTSAGGLFASLLDGAHLVISDNEISGNIARSLDTVDVRGGGLTVQTDGTATLAIIDNMIVDNSALIGGSGSARGGGVEVYTSSSELAQFSGNTVAGNVLEGNSRSGTGLYLIGEQWLVERNRIFQNPPGDTIATARQVVLSTWGTTGIARDNLVAESAGKGFAVTASGTASAHVSNLTVVRIDEADIQARAIDDTATVTLYNSLATDSPGEMLINANVDVGTNLFGGSLGLVDLAGGDYRLSADSPARNAGTNSPPGGLGSTDLEGRARVSEGTVDIGAFEFPGPVFSDRFELVP